jgi:hypothetical protein
MIESRYLSGTFFAVASYLSCVMTRQSKRANPPLAFPSNSVKRSGVMDAKYNYIIDSMKWRIGLNLAGFSLWLATTVVLLRLT